MECVVRFLDNPKEFYEPREKLMAQVVLNLAKTEKINSELQFVSLWLYLTFKLLRINL